MIGVATSAPYRFTWTNVAAGTYTLSAKAIATNPGQAKQDPATHPDMPTPQSVSAPVSVILNAPPTVSLSAPANGALFEAPATIGVAASAADSDGTIARVDFFDGTTLVGSATAAPYAVTLANVAAGVHALSARATDNLGASTTSAAVSVTVDSPPVVSLTAPASNALYASPASIALSATATDAVGLITKVDFYQGATLIGSATTAPYNFSWSNVGAGNYVLTAVATNDAGGVTTSAPVTIRVDAPPSVTLASPAGATFTAPATINLAADATDTVGSVTKVDFYQGTTLIGTANAVPFTFTWTNVAVGSYSLTAVATNDAGMSTTSAAIAVTVKSGVAQMYFIHVDHLNTPRLITNASQQVVWRWDNQEPFGDSPPDENPSGLGTFEFPKRFDGQYADKETGLFYNYFRDYNPALPIFLQSDPLGLRAGLNTYVYAFDPLTQTDPFGLMGRGPAGNSKGGPPARNPNKAGCGPSGGFWNPFVPNNPMGFPFEPCCAAHDKCYDNCQGPDKLGCDMQGCACFFGTCKSYTGYVQGACQWAAQQYCYQITYSSTADEQFKKARASCFGSCKPQ